MTQATKFYLPIFKTGYPFGKLYTYKSGTSTLVSTYKNVDGTLHPNPIIMDEKGNAVIYINEDIKYRYVLYDANNNLIYDENNIKQLNGEAGAPGGPAGQKGSRGKQGVQGISGGQGLPGIGIIGDKGLAYLTKIDISSNTSITIPKGISEVYITGTGGGGSGASWSPYIFLYKKNDNVNPYGLNPPAQVTGETGTRTSTVPITFYHSKFASLMFIPGSGFSGQSVYRKKISLNKDTENILQFFIGTGGARPNNDLNGVDGTSTLVLLNGSKILELKGGLAGKNFFPKDDASIPTLPTDGTPIRLNRGHKTGYLYFNQSGSDNLQTPAQGQAINVWTTTYRQKSGSFFINKEIKLSYYAPLITIGLSSVCTNGYTVSNNNSGIGEKNIFGNLYSFYQAKDDSLTNQPNSYYKTSIKTGVGSRGWGAGGDVYCNFISQQNLSTSGYYTLKTIATSIGVVQSNLCIFEESVIKGAIRNYMSSFNLSDSYNPGVATLPLDSDTSGVWTGVDNIKALVTSSPSTYLMFTGSKFYPGNGLRIPLMAGNPDSAGGKGVDGFVQLEYGNIVEHLPES